NPLITAEFLSEEGRGPEGGNDTAAVRPRSDSGHRGASGRRRRPPVAGAGQAATPARKCRPAHVDELNRQVTGRAEEPIGCRLPELSRKARVVPAPDHELRGARLPSRPDEPGCHI